MFNTNMVSPYFKSNKATKIKSLASLRAKNCETFKEMTFVKKTVSCNYLARNVINIDERSRSINNFIIDLTFFFAGNSPRSSKFQKEC